MTRHHTGQYVSNLHPSINHHFTCAAKDKCLVSRQLDDFGAEAKSISRQVLPFTTASIKVHVVS